MIDMGNFGFETWAMMGTNVDWTWHFIQSSVILRSTEAGAHLMLWQ
jgi:hypothetical protein